MTATIVMAWAFGEHYGQTYEPAALRNPKFKYWVSDSLVTEYKPLYWDISASKGPGDEVSVFADVMGGERCVALRVYQDGANDRYDWATVHLGQTVTGEALKVLLYGKIGIWICPTFSYVYDQRNNNPKNIFGVEVNDGRNILWYVFSDINEGIYPLRSNHRIIVLRTPLYVWSHREILIQEQYKQAGWALPELMSFTLIIGAAKVVPGTYYGYIRMLDAASSTVEFASTTPDVFGTWTEAELSGRVVGPNMTLAKHHLASTSSAERTDVERPWGDIHTW